MSCDRSLSQLKSGQIRPLLIPRIRKGGLAFPLAWNHGDSTDHFFTLPTLQQGRCSADGSILCQFLAKARSCRSIPQLLENKNQKWTFFALFITFLHFGEELFHKEVNGFLSVDSNSILLNLLFKQLIHILP